MASDIHVQLRVEYPTAPDSRYTAEPFMVNTTLLRARVQSPAALVATVRGFADALEQSLTPGTGDRT